MTDLARRAAGVTAAVAALVLAAAPALAEGVTRDDQGSDVYTWDTDSQDRTPTPSTKTTNVAVQEVRVAHTRDAFVVRTQMRSLVRNGDYFYLNAIAQRTDGTTYSAFLSVRSSDRNGATVLQSPAGGSTVACRGMTHDVDYARDRLRLSVPRSCLGNPTTFRAYGAVVNYPAGSVRGRIHVDQLLSSTSSGATTDFLDRG